MKDGQSKHAVLTTPCEMKIKRMLLTVMYLIGASQAIAQHKPVSSKWPVPANVPGLLFYIQRDPDINTVCYAVRLTDQGVLNLKDPIDIFWIRYAQDGSRKKLNSIQREFGYGLSYKIVKADSILITAVAFPSRMMHLVKNQQQAYVVRMKINDQICDLKRVYVRITGGSALAPEIEYIEFFGVNSETRRSVTEQIGLR